MNDKTVNYTPAAVAALLAGYDGSADEATRRAQVKALATELGKSEASIRAKLAREGAYVKYAKAPAGKNVIRKAAYVQMIADALNVNVDVVGSLEKATKNTLVRVLDALTAE